MMGQGFHLPDQRTQDRQQGGAAVAEVNTANAIRDAATPTITVEGAVDEGAIASLKHTSALSLRFKTVVVLSVHWASLTDPTNS